MSFTIDLAILPHWLFLIVIAALAGLVVELVRGGIVPLGFLGGVLSALLGAWAFSDILYPRLPLTIEQPLVDGVVIIPAILGALIAATFWSLLGGRRR